ncbi:protein-L-isoaspartate(D-aspartate) O-methyltransferase [Parafrankia irregularis]|uniref:Protein-L-isoaspartate O-methyltransferase n=1 Tax=Parafrankia irregularis TaxID=795642 RepID=A0A0S4R1K4_9ACTN|nr:MULTISPECIES: hypothetical protein [Parafrankia]MBE3206651.1 methyltransferase, FxLD system [Parafrankia sp. CH37]CUU60790.1 protein-L-isoaspartate(D-aspartate) O-methyltransferase [Parafrankia irregularis]
MTSNGSVVSAAALRAVMVDRVLAVAAVSTTVEAAMRAVPRERFVSGVAFEEVYGDGAFGGYGVGRWASVPAAVAVMLDQLAVEPGSRVLEIGSPDGYSTALLSVLAGRTGKVVTTDVDALKISRNAAGLNDPRFLNVELVGGDIAGRLRMPYDRVLLHAPTDIHPELVSEVAEGGRLVLPLRLRGLDRAVAFVRDGGLLVSDSIRPFPGRSQSPRRTATFLSAGVRLDAAGQDVDAGALRDAIIGQRHLVRTGVTLPASLLPHLDLTLAVVRPLYGRLYVEPVSDQQTPMTRPCPDGVSAVWKRGTLAFLDIEPIEDSAVEVRVAAYGPDRHEVADLLGYDIQMWDAHRREGPDPTIRVYPPSTACGSPLPGRQITAPYNQFMIAWD